MKGKANETALEKSNDAYCVSVRSKKAERPEFSLKWNGQGNYQVIMREVIRTRLRVALQDGPYFPSLIPPHNVVASCRTGLNQPTNVPRCGKIPSQACARAG